MRLRREQPAPAGSRAGLDLRLFMSCPQCQGRLTVDEGVGVTSCGNCSGRFIVGPRVHPFRAVVAPTLTADDCRRSARTYLRTGGHRATHVGTGGWWLVPFWRSRAKSFHWLAGLRHRPPSGDEEFRDLALNSFDLLVPAAGPHAALDDLPPRPGIVDAYPLSDKLIAGARMEPIAVAVTEARERVREEIEARSGERDRFQIIRGRRVLVGEELLIVYLPFFQLDYQFRDTRHEVLVDGILGEVIAHREAPAETRTPAPTPASDPVTQALFLPSRCPACGGALAVTVWDRVHPCDSCGTAWEMADGRLYEVRQRIAVSGASGPGARHLPFWALRVTGHGSLPGLKTTGEANGQLTVFVPAFASEHSERLFHIGVHLTQRQPDYRCEKVTIDPSPDATVDASRSPSLAGATLGRRDAERLAWVIIGSLTSVDSNAFRRFIEESRIEIGGAEILWLPFRPSGLYLREPVSGALLKSAETESAGLASSEIESLEDQDVA